MLTVFTVTVLLAVLGVFKYLNFFMSTAFMLAGKTWSDLKIILPLGISFYMLSAIGYVLDVSWGKLKAEQSLLDMALFLSFFPKQVCGPIVNARDFLPQLKEDRRITLDGLAVGVQIFVFGLFKKIVLADHLAVFVDDVFYAPAAYGTATIWLAVFSYFLQLYFDFSGYSDMAVGISKMFGYDLARNFNLPFMARNIAEFWDRWHISLSSWLNEYVFNKAATKLNHIISKFSKNNFERFINIPPYAAMLITFFLSGLWHGAGLTFIVWGLLQGVISIVHRSYSTWMKAKHRKFIRSKPEWLIAIDILANYFTLNLVSVFFRSDSLGQAFYMFKRMFSWNAGVAQPYIWSFVAYAVLFAATMIACRQSRKNGKKKVEGFYPIFNLNTVTGLTCFFIECGLTIMLAYFGETYFVYGQF